MTVYGYARVSSADQHPENQFPDLRAAGAEEIVEETGSAAGGAQPVLRQLLADLVEGDELIVWKMDRLGRNMIEILQTIQDLEARGITLKMLDVDVDTSSATGELFVTQLAAFARFERRRLIERTLAGQARARKNGVRFGRPERCGPNLKQEILALHEAGFGTVAIYKSLNERSGGHAPSRSTIWRVIKNAEGEKALALEDNKETAHG